MKRLIHLFTALLTLAVVSAPVPVLAAGAFQGSKDAVCSGVALDENATCDKVQPDRNVNDLVKKSLGIFSAVVGVIAVFVVLISGLKYMTSNGDASKTAQAKDTLMYAAIGLAIALLAQVIVRFVINKVNTP
jgi:hypothetical protein